MYDIGFSSTDFWAADYWGQEEFVDLPLLAVLATIREQVVIDSTLVNLPPIPVSATLHDPSLTSVIVVYMPVTAVEATVHDPTLVDGSVVVLQSLAVEATVHDPTLVDESIVSLPVTAVHAKLWSTIIVRAEYSHICLWLSPVTSMQLDVDAVTQLDLELDGDPFCPRY